MATPTPKRAHQCPSASVNAPPEDEFVLKLRRYMAGTIPGQEAPLSAEIGARALYIATRLKKTFGRTPTVSSADSESAVVQVVIDDDRELFTEVTPGSVEAVTYGEAEGLRKIAVVYDDDLLLKAAGLV